MRVEQRHQMHARQIGLAALLAATQLAAAAPSSESVQAARIARDRFYGCTQGLVADYDDRISPVNVVAKALAAKCQPSALTWANAMLKYMDREEAKDMYDEVMRGEEGNLVAIVLRHRVLKSAPSPATQKNATAPAAAKTLK
jgi:hypothetical protein